MKLTQNFQVTVLVALLASILPSWANALSFQEAAISSLDTHPSVSTKRHEYEAAKKRVISSVAQLGPNLSYQRTSNSFGNIDTVRIQQPLFAGGRLWGGVKEAQARRDSANFEISLAEQNLLVKVAEAYVDLLRINTKIELSKANYAEHNRLFDLIKRRVDAGLSSQTDATSAEMRLNQALSEYQQIVSNQLTTIKNLEELIGRSIEAGEKISPVENFPFKLSFDEAKELTLANSPALSSLNSQIESAVAKGQIERSALLPQVYLRHEKNNSNTPGILKEQTYVAVEYQFGNGVSSVYNWGAATNVTMSVSSSMANTQKEVTLNFVRDWNQLELLKRQLPVVKKQAAASSEVAESFIRQYGIGKKTWLDVLNSQRELYQTLTVVKDTELNLTLSSLKVGILTGLLNVNSN